MKKKGGTSTGFKSLIVVSVSTFTGNTFNVNVFDKNVSYIDNFVHLIGIESSLIVQESLPLNKAILADFVKFMEGEKQQFIGISAKPTHPKMKATLIKLGFNTFKDNKEILTYKL